MVLFLLRRHAAEPAPRGRAGGAPASLLRRNLRAGVLLSVLLAIEVAWGLATRSPVTRSGPIPAGVVAQQRRRSIGLSLFTDALVRVRGDRRS
jgi:hypothetical protein